MQKKQREFKFYFLLSFFSIWVALAGAARFSNCKELAHKISHAAWKSDAAVEVEIRLNSTIMSILTTTDGTIGPLFTLSAGVKLPDEFLQKALTLNLKNPLELLWSSLEYQQKINLINLAGKHRIPEFDENRTIAGLKILPTVELTFAQKTKFLGKNYEAGIHTVDISKFVGGPIEYQSPSNIGSIRHIEFHFRGRMRAGNLSNELWKLEAALTEPLTHQHVHIVAPLPLAQLKEAPLETALELTDYFRRVNLAAEFLSIIDGGNSLRPVESKVMAFFDYLKAEQLSGIAEYFLGVGEGKEVKIGDRFKMAAVGFRGSDKYDQPGLYGFEFRSINRDTSAKTLKELLNSIQHGMNTSNFGIGKERFKVWLKTFINADPSQTSDTQKINKMSKIWYGKNWHELEMGASETVKPFFADRKFRNEIIELSREQLEIKMLFHDWSMDPLIFDNPQLQKTLLEIQLKVLTDTQKFFKNSNETDWDKRNLLRAMVHYFIKNSGLFELVNQSIGGVAR